MINLVHGLEDRTTLLHRTNFLPDVAGLPITNLPSEVKSDLKPCWMTRISKYHGNEGNSNSPRIAHLDWRRS